MAWRVALEVISRRGCRQFTQRGHERFINGIQRVAVGSCAGLGAVCRSTSIGGAGTGAMRADMVGRAYGERLTMVISGAGGVMLFPTPATDIGVGVDHTLAVEFVQLGASSFAANVDIVTQVLLLALDHTALLVEGLDSGFESGDVVVAAVGPYVLEGHVLDLSLSAAGTALRRGVPALRGVTVVARVGKDSGVLALWSKGAAATGPGVASLWAALDEHVPEDKPRTQSAVPSALNVNSTKLPPAPLAKRASPIAASLASDASAAVPLCLASSDALLLRLGQSRCQ
eukprot:6173494-Pleurochrysis_carterae.AAC.2